MIPFLASLIFLHDLAIEFLGIGRSFYNIAAIISIINWIAGIIMLFIGVRHLDRLE